MMEGYTILSLLLCLSVASAYSNGDVRLAGTGSKARMGRVELLYNDEWGTVCDDYWGYDDADVVCRQLGYPAGASRFTISSRPFGPGSGKIFLDNVSCDGNEDRITECHALTDYSGGTGCTHNEDAGVKCQGCTVDSDCEHDGTCNMDALRCMCPTGYSGPNCETGICAMDSDCEHDGICNMDTLMCICTSGYSGDTCEIVEAISIRLAGKGSSPSQGRVEVYANGKWGTVCDNSWGPKDANVVCRQLGFPGVSGFTTRARKFGEGTGPILLDNVKCVGDETSIMDCQQRAIENNNCGHDEDAGVICQEDERRREEHVELYHEIREQEADWKKKDVLQALYDLLAELKDK